MTPPANSPPAVNLLVAGTSLAALERVPPYADQLWKLVHAVEGRCLLVSGLFLGRLGEAFDRLGLAEVARSEIGRYETATAPPESVYLRYHAVALFEHLGRLLGTLAAFVREHLE